MCAIRTGNGNIFAWRLQYLFGVDVVGDPLSKV